VGLKSRWWAYLFAACYFAVGSKADLQVGGSPLFVGLYVNSFCRKIPKP